MTRPLPEESITVGARLGPQGWQCLCEGTRVQGGVLADRTYKGGKDGLLLEW